jgi:predicted GNAT family acetyltransferase
MSTEVKQLGSEHESSLGALLSSEPIRNLHPLAVLEEVGISPGPASSFYGCFRSRQLVAAALIRPSLGLVVPASCTAADALALGTVLAGKIALRSCFGDKAAVEALVSALCPSKPRLSMPHRLFTASADYLGPFVTPALRLANEHDFSELISMTAAEDEEVFERNPKPEHRALQAQVLERIQGQRTWVLEHDGRLVLKVDVVAQSRFGAELQGLFTLRDDRFLGFATLALGQLSRHMLSSLPHLALRIADSADSLLAVARKVGYVNGQTEQLLVFT